MTHAKNEPNFTTVTLTSSPKGYYVQSTHDSHEGTGLSAYLQSTQTCNNFTVTDSPLNRSSYTRTSNNGSSFSAGRISSHWRWPRGNRKRNSKEWQDCRSIQQNHLVDSYGTYGDGMDAGRSYLFILFMILVFVFAVFCLIVWSITRPYETQVRIMSLIVDEFNFGQGSDRTGVPTKFVTVNCTVTMSIYNPAKFFGIYVSSNQVDLMYSEITVVSGALKKYFQPRRSSRVMSVNLDGRDIPLYGAATMSTAADDSSEVAMKLEIEVQSRGYLIGRLIKRKHRIQISCSLLFNPSGTKEIKFQTNSCVYD